MDADPVYDECISHRGKLSTISFQEHSHDRELIN